MSKNVFPSLPFGSRPLAAFDPPSDFVEEPAAGGNSRKGWKIFGCGCGSLILIMGILIALGTAKFCSFVGDVTEVSTRTMAMKEFSEVYAQSLALEDPKTLHEKFGPELRAQHPLAAFAKELESYRPFMRDAVLVTDGFGAADTTIQSANDLRNISKWQYQGRFYPRQGEKMLRVMITLTLADPTQKVEIGQSAQGQIERLQFDLSPISFPAEPPAREVLAFHGTLQSGDIQAAYRKLAMRMRTDQSAAQFEQFIQTQGTLFTQSTMEILEVRYPSPSEAVVTAMVKDADGKKAVVTYEMVDVTGWRISAIAPLVETTEDAAAPEPMPDGAALPEQQGIQSPEAGADDAEEGASEEGKPRGKPPSTKEKNGELEAK